MCNMLKNKLKSVLHEEELQKLSRFISYVSGGDRVVVPFINYFSKFVGRAERKLGRVVKKIMLGNIVYCEKYI